MLIQQDWSLQFHLVTSVKFYLIISTTIALGQLNDIINATSISLFLPRSLHYCLLVWETIVCVVVFCGSFFCWSSSAPSSPIRQWTTFSQTTNVIAVAGTTLNMFGTRPRQKPLTPQLLKGRQRNKILMRRNSLRK